jgi:hypothetical protein
MQINQTPAGLTHGGARQASLPGGFLSCGVWVMGFEQALLMEFDQPGEVSAILGKGLFGV